MIRVYVIGAICTTFMFNGVEYKVPGICGEPTIIEVNDANEYLNLIDAIDNQICRVIVSTVIPGKEYNFIVYNDYLE